VALRARFEEAGGRCDSDDERLVLELCAEQSPYLMELLIGEPALLASAVGDPFLRREKPLLALRAEIAAELDRGRPLPEALRRVRNREYVRLGARELGGLGRFEEVGRELAHLADACFEAALGQPAAPFVVFAMGKHGGEELNFSSDVDVIYVYGADEGDSGVGGVTPHEYFARLADRLTRTIAERTEHGACFRVDLRLRPEGQRGPLVNSLAALERYYETWGRPWERQAWIKARPAAGDPELAAETLAMIAPFCWPRTVGPGVLDEVRLILARAQAERRDAGDVKLGPGGIREVEFFVQALQLLHGGKNPQLRERGTLRALDRLLFAGLVSAREQRALSEAYVFLRRVENRLQLEQGAQTHEVPPAAAGRERLARGMGFAHVAAFDEALEAQRREVRALWSTLGVEDAPKLVVDFGAVPFRDPEAAGEEIALLAGKPDSPLAAGAAGPAAEVARRLVEELGECPDPDQALRHLVDFVGRRPAHAAEWRLLFDHRPLAKLLASLFGTSEFLARRFVEHPDLLDTLVEAGRAPPRRTGPELAAALAERVAAQAGDYEDELRVLRRVKQEEELRIGLADISGALEIDEVTDQLSMLAEALVRAALALVVPQPRTPLSVVAMGTLGGGEIDFGSDLDLVFVHGGAELEDHERCGRLAQRLIRALGAYMENGRLYEIDTRLRPSGRHGLLVTTLPALRAYHEGEAALWERQALLKARAVAGDAQLGAAFDRLRDELLFGPELPVNARVEMARLRARMENELAGEKPGLYNPKLGRGGLVDIEFVVQFQQLMYGKAHPEVRSHRTREALAALAAAGLVDGAQAAALDAAHLFLRRLENRLRIVHDRPGQLRTDPPAELDKLARRMGYRGPDGDVGRRLLADYLTTTRAVRELYDRTFSAEPWRGPS
jgi:glutamate-ammonia-ligase adenylyltransferase